MVLERIKRKAGRATVSHGARKEQPEEDTRVSIDNEERDDNISDQENGFMIDTVEDTILSASIPKDILKRLEVWETLIFTTSFRDTLAPALVQNAPFFSLSKLLIS